MRIQKTFLQQGCALALAWAFGASALFAQVEDLADRVTVEVQNELAANTAGLEFSPTFYEDGIVFISTNTAGLKKITDTNLKLSAMSILRSRRNSDGQLLPPEPFAAELSSIYTRGLFVLTAPPRRFTFRATTPKKAKMADNSCACTPLPKTAARGANPN